ncbi:bifunctional 4'-phosphopantothenoylcysteine decarboxylase/phosphopantothenoylcysteine synthetase, partial [Listeria monocytogenes]|nr:bifunctional 4'-phosphopantothenoylcysteine decarboxylase/phosphopantothenoylcysteine synthetase [Listeria monocytogenes]
VPHGVEAIYVESAEEMHQAVNERKVSQDIFVMTAAVADYTPAQVSDQKIKKQPGDFTIAMKRTKDILLEIGQHKTSEQVVIGFAAETENVEANARKKLTSKNADMIVANNISEAGAGFSGDTNIVTFYRKDGSSEALPILDKKEVAEHIIKEAANFLRK